MTKIKMSFGNKDKPFFLSKKEIEIMRDLCKEYEFVDSFIHYVLVDGNKVQIKRITRQEFENMELVPALYQVDIKED